MFERRQRATSAMHFNQVQRPLQTNESLPALPGLAAQLLACQADKSRLQRVENIEPCDELNLAFSQDEDFDD